MTTTHFAAEDLMVWVDGELAASQAEAIEAHVAECAECAAVAAQFRGMSEELAGWRVKEVPGRVEAGVMEVAMNGRGASSHVSKARRGAPRPGGGVRWMRWEMGIGGAVVAAVVLLVMVSPRSHESRPMYEMASPPPAPSGAYVAPASDMDVKVAQSQDGLVATDKAAASLEEHRMRSEVGTAQARAAQAQLSENLKDVATGGSGGAPPPAVGRTPSFVDAAVAPMIARAVSLTVRVKDVEAARPAVEAVVARHRGYAAQMNANSAEGSARGFTASLRIPAAELVAALKELRGLGRVDNESQSGEEVTQQHQDLVARLKNAREEETRLQAILAQRTGRISDVLEVEQEIARVRGEIESMEAEQAGLEHRVDFASVDLTLVEEYKAQFAAPDSVGTRVRNSFVAGIRSAWDTVLGTVLFCEEVGPAMVVWGVMLAVPVFFVWRRYRRMLVGGSRN